MKRNKRTRSSYYHFHNNDGKKKNITLDRASTYSFNRVKYGDSTSSSDSLVRQVFSIVNELAYNVSKIRYGKI